MTEHNLLDEIFGPDLILGLCDECRQVKTFGTERERELWQKYHAHDDGDGA